MNATTPSTIPGTQPYRPKVWTNLNKLRLENIVDQGNGEIIQSFSISFRQGYPRLHLTYTNSEAVDFRDRVYNIPLDVTMLTFIADNIILAASDATHSISITMKNVKWVDGKRTDDLTIVGTVSIGRDSEGFVMLMFKVEGKPNIYFKLLPSKKWFTITKDGVDVTSLPKTSEVYGRSFANLLKETTATYMSLYSDKYDTKIT